MRTRPPGFSGCSSQRRVVISPAGGGRATGTSSPPGRTTSTVPREWRGGEGLETQGKAGSEGARTTHTHTRAGGERVSRTGTPTKVIVAEVHHVDSGLALTSRGHLTGVEFNDTAENILDLLQRGHRAVENILIGDVVWRKDFPLKL